MPTPEKATTSSNRVSLRLGPAGVAEDRLLLALEKRYRLVAQLGEGGTARVWLAMAKGPSGFNKLVVLKTIRGELFDDPAVVEMFLEEARLAARLNHPHIVQTNEVFQEAQHPVIVMEYLDGVPFSVVLERQREGNALALAMLLRIVSDALAGLHAAHEVTDYDGTPLSVVHRDVSPHNLFVTFTGQTKVLDFGIAQLNSRPEYSESGVIKGKLRYISPEQISGETPVDRRADIYSMGVVLWEIATAQRMWAGIPEPQIMKRILGGDLPSAREVEPNVDDPLAEIIERALSMRAEDRYETALEFQADLDTYLATLGGALRNRDVGRALSKMFDDVRQERKETIEAQLAQAGTIRDLHLNTVPELTSFSNVNAPRSMGRFSLTQSPRALTVFAILAMLLFAVLLFFPLPAPAPPPPQQPSAALRPVAQDAPTATPEPPKEVEVRLTAFPQGAQLKLDGEPLASNPFVGRFPVDKTQQRQLSVTAPGYRTEKRQLVFERNLEMVLTLHRAPTEVSKPRPRPSQAPRTKSTRPATMPQTAVQGPDCSTPFYFDKRGVKKYRPECLSAP